MLLIGGMPAVFAHVDKEPSRTYARIPLSAD